MGNGRIGLLLMTLMLGLSTHSMMAQTQKLDLLNKKQVILSCNVRNYGMDFGIFRQNRILRFASGFDQKILGFSVGYMHDPREMKVTNERLPGGKPFVIEKINHSMCFRFQMGRSFSIAERRGAADIGLRLNVAAELPMNYAWPVQVWLYQPAVLTDGYLPVFYNPQIHDVGLVGGIASYSAGMNRGQLIPGVGGRVGLQADWGNYRSISNSLAIGFQMDCFLRKLPIWYRNEMNRNIFPALFVTFAVGFEPKTKK